jgi:hypothetical protein
MQIRRYPALIQLAIFSALGPPIGALSLLLWDHLVAEQLSPFGVRIWLGVTFFAYLYGLPAALVTGWSAARARTLSPGLGPVARIIRFSVPVTVGAVTSVLFSLATIASEPDLALAAAGAVAAFVCTALAELLRLRPNNSFKPKPLRGSA